jgi:homoserine kinase
VFNLGRIALLIAAMYEQRLDLLAEATKDRLHQPARLAVCDVSAKAYRLALETGAHAAWLSGSGPTVAVVVDDASLAPVTTALADSGKVLQLAVDEAGAIPID